MSTIDNVNLNGDVYHIRETIEDGSITSVKLAEGAVTNEKIANQSVTLEKTDFYVQSSVELDVDWITKSYAFTKIPVVTFPSTQEGLASMIAEMPDVVSVVFEVTNYYWTSGNSFNLTTRSSSWTYFSFSVTKTLSTLEVSGKTYGIMSFTKSDFEAAYQDFLNDIIENGHIAYSAKFQAGNASGKFVENGLFKVVSGTVTSDIIETGFIETSLSPAFVSAVNAALEADDGDMTHDETIAKNRLTGKVMICLGDSYTYGMGGLLTALGTKYGMSVDNRGIVSSSICGTWSGATGTGTGYRPMWRRASEIVNDYSSGYVIDETTYTVSDVAFIVFMGGANDGFGIETWIGTGIHETDTSKIYGACNHIFNVLQENFPDTKIICITQPSSYNREVSSITDDATAQILGFENLAELQVMSDVQFSNYAMALKENAVKETAWAYGVPVIDMFNEFPSMFNPSNRSKYWSGDKLHLSSAGYSLISAALDKKIVELTVG